MIAITDGWAGWVTLIFVGVILIIWMAGLNEDSGD